MRTRVFLATVAVATLTSIASAASAALPTREGFGADFEFSGTCPAITIAQHHVAWGAFNEFSPTRWRLQFHVAGTMTANGKTVASNHNAVTLRDPTTTVHKVVGTVENVEAEGRQPAARSGEHRCRLLDRSCHGSPRGRPAPAVRCAVLFGRGPACDDAPRDRVR